MPQWEYRKINLSHLPPKADDIDLLCDVGEDGWELVTLTANNIAYLKRQITRGAVPQGRKTVVGRA